MNELLNQTYLSASDIKTITGFGMNTCREIVDEVQKEMESKNYYIPQTKKKLVLTKLVKKKLGI